MVANGYFASSPATIHLEAEGGEVVAPHDWLHVFAWQGSQNLKRATCTTWTANRSRLDGISCVHSLMEARAHRWIDIVIFQS